MHFIDFTSKSLCLWCVKQLYHDAGVIDLFFHQPYLCYECKSLVSKPIVFNLKGVIGEAIVAYEQTIERIIFRYKEDKDISMSVSFFYQRRKYFSKHREWVFLLAPSSPEKTKERGFHALYEMIKPYASIISTDLYKSDNIKQSKQQKEIRKNIKNTIQCQNVDQFDNRKVIIVDDVVTTGATLQACYDLIKDHAIEVKYFVFAIHPLLITKQNSVCYND